MILQGFRPLKTASLAVLAGITTDYLVSHFYPELPGLARATIDTVSALTSIYVADKFAESSELYSTKPKKDSLIDKIKEELIGFWIFFGPNRNKDQNNDWD